MHDVHICGQWFMFMLALIKSLPTEANITTSLIETGPYHHRLHKANKIATDLIDEV